MKGPVTALIPHFAEKYTCGLPAYGIFALFKVYILWQGRATHQPIKKNHQR
jgi:hypothetical protein